MDNYGTKGYYKKEACKARLRVQLLEEAIEARIAKKKFTPRDTIETSEVLKEAYEEYEKAEKALEACDET